MPALSSSPIDPALAHLASVVEAKALSDADNSGLLATLRRVPDPRERRGVRHSLAAILAVTARAVLAGCRSLAAIGEWCANASEQALGALGVDGRPPSESTIRRTLQQLDGDHFDMAIGEWAAARSRPVGTRRAVAVDGKTVRGSGDAGVEARHLLAAIDHHAGVVLAQCDVAAKTNEIPMFSQILNQITDLKGAVITADALHAQRDHAEFLVTRREAHFVLTVKGNQPSLCAQLKALPWRGVPNVHTCTGQSHGRDERRTLKVVTVTAGIGFPRARQAIQLTRKTRKPGTRKWTSVETVYAVTSLASGEARPAELAAWIRGHWHIENRLHWVRDVTFDEDRSQVRTASGPRVMASMRNLAVSALRLTGVTNIAQGLRHHAWDPLRPVKLLLTS